MKPKSQKAISDNDKRQIINRLVHDELHEWQAGEAAGRILAMNYLTVFGFKNLSKLDDDDGPKELYRYLSDDGPKSNKKVMAYWVNFVGPELAQFAFSPKFAKGVIHTLKTIWEETREEVEARLAECPWHGSENDDEDDDEGDDNDETSPEPQPPSRRERRPRGRRWDLSSRFSNN